MAPALRICEISSRKLGAAASLGVTAPKLHKSYLVNLDQVRELLILDAGRYELILKNGESLPQGRTRIAPLKQQLGCQ